VIAELDVATFGSHLMATITLTLWAFLGLECATIPAASVVDPARTIPRATVIGTPLRRRCHLEHGRRHVGGAAGHDGHDDCAVCGRGARPVRRRLQP
jgi:amino acid transporter